VANVSTVSFQPYPEEYSVRFDELAELFFECRKAFRDVAHETNWRPAPDSAAAADLGKLADHNPPYPPGTSARISNLTYFYLFAASEHLGGLGALYHAHEVLIPTGALERCVLEHCARVLWVLQRGDGSLEDRLARVYLEELLSAEEAKKTSGRLLGRESVEHRAQAEKFKTLREETAAIFGEPIMDEKGRAKLKGLQLLGLEDCVAWALEFMSQPIAGPAGKGIYDFFSNISHPTLYPLLQMWTVAEQNGQMQVVSQVSVENHEKQARLAVISFYEALSYVMSYNNWPRVRHDELTEAIDRLLPGVFVATATISTPPHQASR
jgi:hypothetical protein